MSGFIDFIRKQGVIGLAVGFILGGAVSKVVTALVEDIINPIIGVALGRAGDFLIIALVLYYGVKALKLDQFDKKD